MAKPRFRSAAFIAIAALWPLRAAHPQQLTATELSLGPAGVVARHTFVGGELGLARRTGTESRLALALAGGTIDRLATVRAQLTLQVLVNPSARSGVGVYAGLGAAFVGRRESAGQGFVALLVGLEGKPGRPQGWYVEAGLGGGARAAMGWRLRWFPAWWRRQGS